MMTNILHIYAQYMEHTDAFIVGDKVALIKLRDAINEALEYKEAVCRTYANDGEGYDALVLCVDSLDGVAFPYTHEMFGDQENKKWPYQLVKDYKQLKSIARDEGKEIDDLVGSVLISSAAFPIDPEELTKAVVEIVHKPDWFVRRVIRALVEQGKLKITLDWKVVS